MFFENPSMFWLLILPLLLVGHYLYMELKDRLERKVNQQYTERCDDEIKVGLAAKNDLAPERALAHA